MRSSPSWPTPTPHATRSAFRTTGEMTVHRGCAVRKQPDQSSVLTALVAISEGRWANGLSGTMDSRELRDHSVYQRRTIAESRTRPASGLPQGRLVLHRTLH